MPRINVKDKRRSQLIEANIASIARRGITDTTITHVSEGAGLSRGIINFYFTTKEAMMRDTLRVLSEDYTAHWREALEKKKDAPPVEQLQALVGANFDARICSMKRLAVWAAFWGHASGHREYAKIIRDCEDTHELVLAKLWERAGGEKGGAQTLHTMIRGSWLMMLTGGQDVKMLAQACFRTAEKLLAPASTAPKKKAEKEEKVVKIVEAKPKQKKEKAPPVSDRQLDFGDLFGG